MSNQGNQGNEQRDALPTRAQLDEAEAYVRRLNLQADEWLFEEPQQFYRVGEVAGRLFGMQAQAVREACERGDIPFATMVHERLGWRIDRQGLLWFVAQQRRKGDKSNPGASASAVS